MSTTTTIPITVKDDATARIAELGMESELEELLEHTRQTVPGLRAIEVELDFDAYGKGEQGVNILAYRDDPGPECQYDPVDTEWGRWKIQTFRPEVCMIFVLCSVYEE